MQTQYPLAIITTEIEGDLLAILSQVNLGFTTGQLQRMIDDRTWKRPKSLPVIRGALERLTVQGIVTKETESTAPIYRFNRDHLAAEPITVLARMRSLLLDRLHDTVAAWSLEPVYGALFGSAAMGQMRPDSDVDVLLVQPDGSNDDTWQSHVYELENAVRRWTGNPCHVLSLTDAETQQTGTRRVLGDVVETGLPFAGPSSWLRRRVLPSQADDR